MICDYVSKTKKPVVFATTGYTEEQIKHKAKIHPQSGYRVSNLFTGANGLSIDEEIKKAQYIIHCVLFICHNESTF